MQPQSRRGRPRSADRALVNARATGGTEPRTEPRGVRLSEQQVARRRTIERIWIVLGIVWAVARVFIAKATVEKYGVNIAMFAVVEILVAWPHSLGAARVVTKLIDRDPHGALSWGLLLAVSHIAPELYVAMVGSNMPAGVYISLAVIVVGLGALAIVGIVQKVCAGRIERANAAQTPAAGRTGRDGMDFAPLGEAALAHIRRSAVAVNTSNPGSRTARTFETSVEPMPRNLRLVGRSAIGTELRDTSEKTRRVDQVGVMAVVSPELNGCGRNEPGQPAGVIGAGIDPVDCQIGNGDGRSELNHGLVELLSR